MWKQGSCRFEQLDGFFRISCIDDNLQNYYKTNFELMQQHKYSLEELENMIPWEREIYISLLNAYLKEKQQQAAAEG